MLNIIFIILKLKINDLKQVLQNSINQRVAMTI